MGNWAKNRLLESGSTSVVVPAGPTSTRPDSPTFGQFRFNTDSGLLEFFNGSLFLPLSAAGGISYTVDNFTGNGTDTIFTMSQTVALPQDVIVFVGSIYQIPTTNYTVSGYDITFTSAPPNTISVNVIHSET